MSLQHTSERLGRRVDEILAEYNYEPAFIEVRQAFAHLYRTTNELLPTCAEKTILQRKMVELAHLFADAVEMNT